MLKIIILISIVLISCDSKPVGYDQVQQNKEDSSVNSRIAEVYEEVATNKVSTIKYSPVEIVSIEVYNSHITITINNKSAKTIDGLKVGIYLYNNFNEPSNNSNLTNLLTGISQELLNPGQSKPFTWDTNDFNSPTKYKLYIEEIHFTDDSNWNYKTYLK